MLVPNIHINVVGIIKLGQQMSHPVLGQCTARDGQSHGEQTGQGTRVRVSTGAQEATSATTQSSKRVALGVSLIARQNYKQQKPKQTQTGWHDKVAVRAE